MNPVARWRLALRMARRDVVRARGRTALVMAMVGLPVLLVCGLATVYSTNQVSDVESVPGRLGGYQAEVQDFGRPLRQNLNGEVVQPTNLMMPAKSRSAADLERLMSGKVDGLSTQTTVLRTELGSRQVALTRLDLSTPAQRPLIEQYAGRLPLTDDEVLVSRPLDRLGYRPGTVLQLGRPVREVRVVGVADLSYQPIAEQVLGRPGLAVPGATGDISRYLLRRDTPVLWPEVRHLNQAGVTVFSSSVIEHPPTGWDAGLTTGDDEVDTRMALILTIVVTAIALEVVLLAGPAFAVGVRRQSRQLALVAATGGAPSDVRRCILAQALLTGVLASTTGLILSLPLAVAAIWAAPRLTTVTFGPFDVWWVPVLIAWALGALATVVAAWVPARTASRTDVVAVLAGRRGQPRPHRGVPVLGLAAIVVGTGLALLGGRYHNSEDWSAAGILLTVIGAVGLVPLLISAVGRLGAVLPLPLRLAVRDSARQRARTAPAIAAVMAAVASVTALSIGLTSQDEQQRRDYRPTERLGIALVQGVAEQPNGWAMAERATQSVATGRVLLPLSSIGPVRASGQQVRPELYVPPPGCASMPPSLPADAPPTPSAARCVAWSDSDIDQPVTSALVADLDALLADGFVLSPAQRQVLDRGGVLLPHPSLIQHGRARLTRFARNLDDGRAINPHQSQVPAAYLAAHGRLRQPQMVMTPKTATALGIGSHRTAAVVGTVGPGGPTKSLSVQEEERLSEAFLGVSDVLSLYVERGYQSSMTVTKGTLGLAAALAVLVGTFAATGLALSDARPDLATLAAIGARPRTRRVMAAAQAAVIALLGAVTGIAVGFVPGLTVARPLTSVSPTGTDGDWGAGQPVIDVPWLLLLGIGVAVPLLAAAAAGLTVRSRLPMTRRLGA